MSELDDLFAITYKVDFYLFIFIMLSYICLTTISCSNPAGWNLHPDIVSDHLSCHAGYSCAFLEVAIAVGVLSCIGGEFFICFCPVVCSGSGTYSKSICLTYTIIEAFFIYLGIKI